MISDWCFLEVCTMYICYDFNLSTVRSLKVAWEIHVRYLLPEAIKSKLMYAECNGFIKRHFSNMLHYIANRLLVNA